MYFVMHLKYFKCLFRMWNALRGASDMLMAAVLLQAAIQGAALDTVPYNAMATAGIYMYICRYVCVLQNIN